MKERTAVPPAPPDRCRIACRTTSERRCVLMDNSDSTDINIKGISVPDPPAMIVTGKPCRVCGFAIGVIVDDPDRIEEAHEEYPVTFPPDWAEGYETPAYIYCDNPMCSQHDVAEWETIQERLPEWMDGEAPITEEVAGGEWQ